MMIGGSARTARRDMENRTVHPDGYSQLMASNANKEEVCSQVLLQPEAEIEVVSRSRQSRHRFVAAGLVSTAVVASGVVLYRDALSRRQGRVSNDASSSVALSETVFPGPGHCGPFEHGLNYVLWGTQWGASLDHIPTADMCCAMCQGVELCKSWTWIKDAGLKGNPSQCWLKGREPDEKEPKLDYISGVPPPRPHIPPHLYSMKAKVESDEDITKTQGRICAKVEYDTDYLSGDLVNTVPGMHTAEQCCEECHAVAECHAWTWAKKKAEDRNNSVCYLKNAPPKGAWQKSVADGIVSGLPGKHPARTVVTAEGLMASVKVKKPGSIFCFSLMMPKSYEEELLRTQHALGASIFACDITAVYSNMSIFIAPGVTTRVVPSELFVR